MNDIASLLKKILSNSGAPSTLVARRDVADVAPLQWPPVLFTTKPGVMTPPPETVFTASTATARAEFRGLGSDQI